MNFDERDALILSMRLKDGKTLDEIASAFGISQQRVSQICRYRFKNQLKDSGEFVGYPETWKLYSEKVEIAQNCKKSVKSVKNGNDERC